MNTLSTERTPLIIVAEINTIKQQTCKILLTNAIEIGRRLKEAKALLKHGEWSKWLKESVDYSQRTADYLMQLYEEYGLKLLDSSDSDGNPNSQTFANLTYSQALILLGIREEERDSFMAANDVENMSARELQQVVKDRVQALQENDTLKPAESQTATLTADVQFNLHRGNMVKSYDELLKMLTSLARTNPQLKEKYRQEAKQTVDNMANTLKVWPPEIKTNLLINRTHPERN